jgi:hypothetical protein
MLNTARIPARCSRSSLNKGALRAPVAAALLFRRTLAWLSQAR